ncbi:A/G-specific adenine glycosylase [Blattabacterium sp. (Cryptocercus punctulatus) str. Cpu]|uniref:A/G-specific adenine glycosylase n=1 Tax=Blattabacterium sp. (Cryptocercus punctulatus) str. Cpu TaxID=1075399 RepID=UPI00023871AE|nr:A/G-specific adenine glycosylase [Blattabacterium sp. (Cryptocercus punctulatus) str. Cpu]AEU09549.1 A/G-specific adenine glycosylase [Blattabacterium sp. (Cryptocercus punctulatus) str. Cpu]
MDFSKKIINWYKNNHRKLPWRENKNPYYILVSEFMLQQTKVSQTIKYYLDFIQKFPNIEKLAQAEEKEVLKVWEGLGYYKRAINLHFFAKKLREKSIGFFPKKYKELIKYKGIGPYTGAAIASICFNEVVPAIDGNFYRLFSRYLGIYNNITSILTKKIFRTLILKMMDKKNPGIFNQAIMDLGSTLCTPKKVKCFLCPIKIDCFSFKNGTIYELPVKNIIKKSIKNRFFYYIFICNNSKKFFIKKRFNKDIWKGLYEFPLIESEKVLTLLEIRNKIWKKYKIFSKNIIYQIKHKITNQILFIQFLNCKMIQSIQIKKNLNNFFGISYKKICNYPFPNPIILFFKNKKII